MYSDTCFACFELLPTFYRQCADTQFVQLALRLLQCIMISERTNTHAVVDIHIFDADLLDHALESQRRKLRLQLNGMILLTE